MSESPSAPPSLVPEPELTPDSLRHFLPPTRHLVVATLRTLLGIVLLLAVYAIIPLKPDQDWFAAYAVVFVGLALFITLFIRQLNKVYRSDSPALRGLEALAFIATLFVTVFSVGYVVMSESSPDSFTEPLSKIDAFYFTVTVLATVGFGDISAATESAKVLVTLQMVLDLVLIGFAVRLLTSTAKAAASRRRFEQQPDAVNPGVARRPREPDTS